jgi:ribosomal protein S18 acetylase RimI-like enzyme
VKSSECAFIAHFEAASTGEIITKFQVSYGCPIFYIWSINILKPYRGPAVGERLLMSVMDAYTAAWRFFLHVRVTNNAGRRLCEKKGFEVVVQVPAHHHDKDSRLIFAANWHYRPPDRRR